jgi:histone deacetylase 11
VATLTRVDPLEARSGSMDSLRKPEALARILEVPIVGFLPGWLIDRRILKPMRLATGGTILACRLALEHGVAINLGGGYHHAAAAWGGGFCVYADIPLAATILHSEGRVDMVMVVDLDAHQGNGTAAVFRSIPVAMVLSGGYSTESWRIHADGIEGILTRFDRE